MNDLRCWEVTVYTISPNRAPIFMKYFRKSFLVGLGGIWSKPWAQDQPCPMLEEFRFEDCSFFPIEIFIDLYKNTTFNLKSPLASLYKHRKCYWALEISFNEGKVFLLKSVIFSLSFSQHNIFGGTREAGLFWGGRKWTHPRFTKLWNGDSQGRQGRVRNEKK